MNSERPNIVFFFTDQQRWDTAGCYGQRLPVTPNLDALAETSTVFENAFTCQPVCGPARACLQTGVYASQNGCFRNNIALPHGIPTLAECFNSAGYDTAYVGKWHLASDDDRDLQTKPVPAELRGGYRSYWMASDVLEFTSHGYGGYVYDINNNKVSFDGYRADCITDLALDYIQNRQEENPFFLFLSHIEPHHQNDRLRFECPHGTRKNFKNYDLPGDLAGAVGDYRLHYPDYLSCCNRLDYNLGRLIETLKEKGVFENTVIFFTSDHGSHFRTRNAEYKRSCHDASTHIPLVIHGGSFLPCRVNGLVSLVDLPPTMLAAAGIDVPPHFEGKVLSSSEDCTREQVYIEISESQTGRAVRTRDWKYSVSSKSTSSARAAEYREDFLYNLIDDPHERRNLIASPGHEHIRAELRGLLCSEMKKIGEEAVILPR